MSDVAAPPLRSVLRHLDADALRAATRSETRSRQRHLPPISVYRWWARRTETVTGAIIDAINVDAPGRLLIADTFAGGGVIALAALVRGHQVYAQDVNPWAARSLATMLALPSGPVLAAAGERLHALVEPILAAAYSTTMSDGTPGTISHTLRVATASCPKCACTLHLYPGGLASLLTRVDAGGSDGYVACPAGHLTLASADKRTSCGTCRRYVKPTARYTTGRKARCIECHWTGSLSELAGDSGFDWEPVLVERCGRGRREIAVPTADEINAASPGQWNPRRTLPLIEAGVETSVLHRHGMKHWHDLYPSRQRVVLERLLEACPEAADGDAHLQRALEAAVIGSTEMAGLASRWDGRYLKPYEVVANHRFSFTTFAAEPNVWGAAEAGRGTVDRRLEHFAKASLWLDECAAGPLSVDGPRPAASRRSPIPARVNARVVSGSSERLCVPAGSISAAVTDPPYHDDVHYAELSDIFRAWAGETTGALDGDAIVRRTAGTKDSTDAYRRLLTNVFTDVARALQPGGHLVLSYANRHPSAWIALFSALQDAGFRAAGYTVVHSENEVDHAKAGRRSCTLDVLIDLVTTGDFDIEQHTPQSALESDEAAFCDLVGAWALRIGALTDDWSEKFTAELRNAPFLSELRSIQVNGQAEAKSQGT